MTQTAERRPLTRPAPPTSGGTASVLVPGAVSAAWALGAGLVALALPVLLVWAADSRSGSGAADALRTAGQLWLVAHGGDLHVPGGTVGLTPLGLSLLPLALLHRAGRHAARTVEVTGPRHASALVAAASFPYAVAAGLLASLSATDAVTPAVWPSLLGALLLAVLGLGSGVVRESRLHVLTRGLPLRVRALARATAAATAVLVAGGALVSGLALVAHAGRATSLASAAGPGLVGGVALLVLGVLLVPNAALWGVSFVTGPGFAVGVGTSVTPFGTTLGAVPAVPVLAALPSGDAPAWLAVAACAVPLVAGVLAGVLLHRRALDRPVLSALLAGPCTGVAVLVLAWLSGGPLGGGRLTDVGPVAWQVGLAAALEVGLVAAATVGIGVRRDR